MIKFRGPHFQFNCTDNIKNSSNKFQTKTPTQLNHNGNNYKDNFCNSRKNNMFPTGTLSFQASHPIKSGNDFSVSIDAIKHFGGKPGQNYSFKKK